MIHSARPIDRILSTGVGVRFTGAEIAVIAMALSGSTSIATRDIPVSLQRAGWSFAGLGALPPTAFVRTGWTKRVGQRIELLKSASLDACVSEIARRVDGEASGPSALSAPPRPPPRVARAPRPPPTPRPTPRPPPRATQRPEPARVQAPPAPRPEAQIPPPAPAGVRWSPFDLDGLLRALDAPMASPRAVLHALEAHALASAEQFDELLALATLRGVETHAYQVETVRRVLRQFRGRTLLADEVGLGKTIEAIMALREYQLRGMVRRALILVPPALVGQWAGELREKAGIDAHVATDIDAAGDFWRRDGVVVASQALARMQKHADVLHTIPWDLVIVDEAHRAKNRTTQTFKLVDGLKSRFLLLLTATPVENDLEEVYNLVTLLKPGQLSTRADFRRRFVDPKDPTRARDAHRLREILADVMVRNTRATCGLTLPPRYVSTVAVEPTPAERRLYEAILEAFRAHRDAPGARRLADTLLLEAGSSAAAVQATLRNVEAPRGFQALEGLARGVDVSAKGDALVQIVSAHREKVLVFTRYRETLAAVERHLRRAGLDCAVVHGGLDRARKEQALQRFRDTAPILLSTDVGSEGHNLQFAHVLVNFDLPWNPMVIEQRIGRLHRYGQTEAVRVYNLCAKGTAEERLLEVLDGRVHLFELVVGEMDLVLGNLVQQQDLEERVLSIFARHRDDAAIDAEFDAIARDLAGARGQYEKVRELDQTLFGKDLEA